MFRYLSKFFSFVLTISSRPYFLMSKLDIPTDRSKQGFPSFNNSPLTYRLRIRYFLTVSCNKYTNLFLADASLRRRAATLSSFVTFHFMFPLFLVQKIDFVHFHDTLKLFKVHLFNGRKEFMSPIKQSYKVNF